MRLKYFMLFALLHCFIVANEILGITSSNKLVDIPTITMPYVENDKELLKDDANQSEPTRYAVMLDVNLNPSNSGMWFNYDDNYKVWKLHVNSADAIGLKLLFDEFHLSDEAIVYIYNDEQDMIIGPLTKKDNHIDNKFGHKLLKGDTIYIEYFIPYTYIGEHQLQISKVIHAYRDIHGYYVDNNRDCGENVACSDADPYEDQVNSVIYLEMYQYICSAVLVNNTNQDLTPYVLTAYHCVEGEDNLGEHNNFTFYFKHQSSSCSGSSGSYSYSRDGSYIRAWGNMSSSDFALLEMDDNPPSYFDPYFSGWSRTTSQPNISVGIHHPSGAPKKINYDNDTATSCGWYSNNTHWCLSWDEGGTQGGSSGSPVFNNNNQIVGQLSGGNQECGGTDYYGKFSTSWNGSSSSNRLNDWLDPDDTNVYSINGTYDGILDSDGDGVENDNDSDDDNPYQCSDVDQDSCDDCTSGSYNIYNDGWDYDGDGLCDSGDSDDDNDGALDWEDSNDNNEFICSDNDEDTCDDCTSGTYDPNNDGCNYAEIYFEGNSTLTNEIEIRVSHQIPIAGFQFYLIDEPDCIQLESAYGGEALEEAFTVTTSDINEYGIVLGFSMMGATIPPGDHILTNLLFSGEGECDACIENVIISDTAGNELITEIGSCIAIQNSILGDISLDGEINVIDVVLIVNNILNGETYDPLGDMNQDGELNVTDIVILMEIILN